MGSMNVKMRAMPEFPSTNLEDIKEKSRKIIEKAGGKGVGFKEEPIAFGLKALIIMFICPENQELEILENKLRNIEGINSLETTDIRRAI